MVMMTLKNLSLCAVLFLLNLCFATAAFDYNQAERSLWLSAAAYCDKSTYTTRTFQGPTSGFVVTKVIYEGTTDTQGYIGYLRSDNSIYVVYRGSSSIRNWITNLNAWKTNYTTYPECHCEVHQGFYEAEQKVVSDVINEVSALRKQFPSYAVKVTGHSLGAALAQLTSMDLVKSGIPCSVYNFGQPRTGDQKYASFSTSKVSTWRVTHDHDIVPHLPFTTGMDFFHVCTEEFENSSGSLKTCTNTCEDPACMNQYDIKDTNVDDHLIYLGLGVNCEAVSST